MARVILCAVGGVVVRFCSSPRGEAVEPKKERQLSTASYKYNIGDAKHILMYMTNDDRQNVTKWGNHRGKGTKSTLFVS